MNSRLPVLLACLWSFGWSALAAEKLTPVTFQLDWKYNVQFAGILVAKEKGYYRDAGLDVTILPVDPEMKMVERVVARTNWIGCAESSVLLAARASGQPIKVIGQMLHGSPMALLSFKEQGLASPTNLVGKKIAIHPDGRKALELLLKHNGISPNQLTVIEREADLTPLLNGECDAVQGYTIDEAVKLELAGKAINVLRFDDHGYQAFSQAYFASEEFLRRDRRTVELFLAVSGQGWRAAALAPEAAADLVVKRYAPGLDRAYQRASLLRVLQLALEADASQPEVGFVPPQPIAWGDIGRRTFRAGILPRFVSVCELLDGPISSLEPAASCQPSPSYPWKSQLRGEAGEVRLRIRVGTDGLADRVEVASGSGFAGLDSACLQMVQNTWVWPPGPARELLAPFEFRPPVAGKLTELDRYRSLGGSFPPPEYTQSALQKREHGTFTLLVTVGTDGLPLLVEASPETLKFEIGRETVKHVKTRWRWPQGLMKLYYVPFEYILK